MKQLIKEYFTFNKRERRGVFVLLSIIVLLILFLIFYDSLFPTKDVDFSSFKKEIAEFDSLNKVDTSIHFQKKSEPEKPTLKLFEFDPNNLPIEKWKALGFSDKQIKIIKNYEARGGKFYNKQDLKKIYGIGSEQYEKLAPYINIASSKIIEEKKPDYPAKQPNKKVMDLVIELNSADSELLVSLNGIGPVFALRIIKYRNSLGGFQSKEQLLEVYGFTQESLDKISTRIIVDKERVKKININTAEFKDLKTHPYIKYNVANAIINYRKTHGNYQSIEGIKKIELITPELFEKLSPYLTTN